MVWLAAAIPVAYYNKRSNQSESETSFAERPFEHMQKGKKQFVWFFFIPESNTISSLYRLQPHRAPRAAGSQSPPRTWSPRKHWTPAEERNSIGFKGHPSTGSTMLLFVLFCSHRCISKMAIKEVKRSGSATASEDNLLSVPKDTSTVWCLPAFKAQTQALKRRCCGVLRHYWSGRPREPVH